MKNNQQEQRREERFTIDEMREVYGIGFMQKGIIGFNEFIKKINKPAQNKEVKTLQECKDEVATEGGHKYWSDFVKWCSIVETMEEYCDQAAELYANQFKNKSK